MPAQAKFDHFIFLFVLGILSLATLSTLYFGFKTYISDVNTGQGDNLLVLQGKYEDEGKVLSGGDNCSELPSISIENNTPNPTSINAEYVESTRFKGDGSTGISLYTLCISNEDEVEHQLVKNNWSSSTTYAFTPLCAKSGGFSCNHTTAQFKNPGTYTFYLQAKPSVVVAIKAIDSSTNDTSSGSSSTSKPSNSPSIGTTSVAEKETLNDVTLPKTFLAKKSTTTDLSKLTDLKKVKNFTLDVPGKAKIVFKDILDLSSDKLVDKFKNLDKYVKISESGKVVIDSKALAALNKKATITMSKLLHLFEPEILIDGKKDTKKVASNVVYNQKTGQLTFDVAGFSTITAVPKIELLEPATDKVENPKALIKGRVSDPNATLTARFNEQDIESILVGVETGEFFLNNAVFKEGENFLTVEAVSKLGKVLPLVKTITYQPIAPAIVAVSNQTNYPLLIVSMIVVMIFLVLIGYLIYRKRKHYTSPKQIQPALVV